jgi:uncharacterized membrane protein
MIQELSKQNLINLHDATIVTWLADNPIREWE